jgi:hypothetical protein
MTIERVKITPTQITLKDANNKVVFDTNNQYIRTETGGNLRLNTQMPAIRFTTQQGQVRALPIQGVILGYVPMPSIISGQTPSFRFPEFTGKLIVTSSNFFEGGPPVALTILTRLKVAINGIFTTSASGLYPGVRHLIFTGGGGVIVNLNDPTVWEWNNISPGTLITLGPVTRVNTDGVTVITDPLTSTPPGGDLVVYTVIAVQNEISSLPLTVTP